MSFHHYYKSLNQSTLIAIVIAVVAILWIGSGFFKSSEAVQETKKMSKSEKMISVKSEVSNAQAFTNVITVTGRTLAFRSSDLAAEIAGRVTNTDVKEGSLVKKGDIILSLAEDDRRALYKQALASLEQAEIEFNASKKLKQKQFNSEIQLATAKANLEAAKAAVEQAKIDLDNTIIKAPYDGLFESRFVEVGDYVKEGTQVASFVDLDPVKIAGFVTEKQIQHLHVGAHAAVELLDGRKLGAEITYLASSADETTRTFAIELEAPNPNMKVIEGLTAKIHLDTETYQAHKISPSILTLDDEGVVGVKTLDSNNEVHFKPVEIISDKQDGMWVTGLDKQERLITLGQEFVIDGQKVSTDKS